MGEEGGTMILLGDGRSYLIDEMDKLKQLVEKHWALLNSVDPDKKTRGFEMINEEGKDCSWHLKDDSSRVADELSALWSRLTEFSRSIDLESVDDHEDDGGMEHKLYNQIVEYLERGEIPYENYTANRYGKEKAKDWQLRCSSYSIADDRVTLKKSGAVVLKKGEVMQVLSRFHQICGHSKPTDMCALLQTIVYSKGLQLQYKDYNGSCYCRFKPLEPMIEFRVSIRKFSNNEREFIFSHGNLGRKDDAKSNLPIRASSDTQMVKILHGFTESEYINRLEEAKSTKRHKFKIARDGKTLLTHSGAIVLKDNEALNLCLRIHELCGHPTMKEMGYKFSEIIYVSRLSTLVAAVSKMCNFCRCKLLIGTITGLSPSPINFRDIKFDIKVHYDEGAVERRFEIIAQGVDSKVVDNYVKNTIRALKKYGRWKEPVFSPEASLARSVLRIVDRLRGNEMKGIESVIEFDPIHNDTVSMEKEQENDMMNEWEMESEMGSIVEPLVDGENVGEEEKDEEEEDMDDEESDVEDEELLHMRRELEETEKQAEHMEKEASRMADATGRMLAYQRQWEFSDFLHEQIEKEENPQNGAVLEESEEEMKDESEEEEEEIEEVKELNKENDSACDEAPGTSNVGLSREEKKRLANKKKRDNKKKNKRKGALEKPPYDLLPYRANYEETNAQYPDATNTVQMERVERERKEMEPVISGPVPLTRNEHPERKRGRLAQMRRDKEILEKNTKKEEEKKVLPVYNPYAAHFNGNTWPEEQMEKIRKNREERERRKEAGLTESEEEEDEDNE